MLEDVTNKKNIPMEEDGDIIFGKHVCQSLKDIKDKRSKELVKLLRIQQLLLKLSLETIHKTLLVTSVVLGTTHISRGFTELYKKFMYFAVVF